MRTLVWLSVLLAAVAFIGEAAAAEYWPMIDGSVYHYVNDSGDALTISINGDEVVLETWDRYSTGQHYYGALDRITTGPSGDVMLQYYSQGGHLFFEPDFSEFRPDVTFLDLPLEVGKTWVTSTLTDRYGTNSFQYEVLREDVVTVPMGTFDVFVVRELSGLSWGYHYSEGDYYLHRDVGPVVLPGGYRLVSIDGAPVPTQSRSVSSVKSLFR